MAAFGCFCYFVVVVFYFFFFLLLFFAHFFSPVHCLLRCCDDESNNVRVAWQVDVLELSGPTAVQIPNVADATAEHRLTF